MTAASARRGDPRWYTPADLPRELIALDDPLEDTLRVGAAGKVGLLELALGNHGGITRVERQYQRVPLHVYRPIYLDERRPDMAFLFVQQFGEGLVQGDRYRIDIDCGPGSATHVTTQAATNVFGARENFASQIVNLKVRTGAVLEYLPDAVVPYRGSRLFQRTRVTVDRDATVIFGETLLPGRVAHREAHAYDLYWAETEVRRADGKLLFTDVLRLDGRDADRPASIGLLGPYDVLAALYVIFEDGERADIATAVRAALSASSEVLAGISELPNRCGISVRLLGPTSKAVGAALRTAWNAARLGLLGAPAPNLRKG
jgi:urease accessory protein